MALPVITSRNQVQTSGLTATVEGRVTAAATGLATVPASKRWRVVSVTGLVDVVGADATVAIAILRGASYRPIGAMVAANGVSTFTGELMLQAGDIVTNIGDSGGTNATIDMTVTYQEYDA